MKNNKYTYKDTIINTEMDNNSNILQRDQINKATLMPMEKFKFFRISHIKPKKETSPNNKNSYSCDYCSEKTKLD